MVAGRDTPNTYQLTDDAGAALTNPATRQPFTFRANDFSAGDAGALVAAARRAGRLQREGLTIRLVGPAGFPTRRYAPEYLQAKGSARWPYRNACSSAGCPNWTHPASRSGGRCPTCYGASIPQEQRERMAAIGRGYAGVPKGEVRKRAK